MINWIDVTLFASLYFIGLAIVIVPFMFEDRRVLEYGTEVRARVINSKKVNPKKQAPRKLRLKRAIPKMNFLKKIGTKADRLKKIVPKMDLLKKKLPKKAPSKKELVYTIWQYNYNGNKYYHKTKHKCTAPKEPGTATTFIISREKPSKVYRLMGKRQKMLFRASGFSLMVLPVVCLCIMVIAR